jgi:hypothetical protein
MSLASQISLITVPQEFARLCTALLHEQHGDDFLPIDDDQPDAGNDGYLKSEQRMFAMHCFKRAQNQGIEQLIRRKMVGDLGKAIALQQAGVWPVHAWTFVSNYPVSERVAEEVVRIGRDAGIDVAWYGPAELAALLQRHPSVRAQFPSLQVNDVSERLGQLHERVVALAHELEPEQPDIAKIPRTPEEQARLITLRPSAWEYLLFAGALLQGHDALESTYLDLRFGIAGRREELSFADACGVLAAACDRYDDALQVLQSAFEDEPQEHAFGPAGVPGDPRAILHLAQTIVRGYGEMLEAVQTMQAIDPPRVLDNVFALARRQLFAPIEAVRSFVSRVIEEIGALPERLAKADGEPIVIDLLLDMTPDETLGAELQLELRRARRKARWRPAYAERH